MANLNKKSRDANLDSLKASANLYFEKERERLDAENKFLRAVLRKRGAEEVSALNLRASTSQVQVEISSYLFSNS